MTPPAPGRRPGSLRAAAEAIEASSRLRVEVIGGGLVVSPPHRGKHAGTIRRLRVRMEPLLPSGLAPYEVSSIALPGDEDDYATPDLTVLPIEWDEDDAWLADPRGVALAVEVISQSETSRGISGKNDWYARAGIGTLLVLDPRTGEWSLFTRPKDGEYRGRVDGVYGEEIELPSPLPSPVGTDDLPLYGS